MSQPDALLYQGRINALNGESGSGKSWVAMQAAAEIMADGGRVIYVDLEDHAGSVVARFRDLGLPDEVIVGHLHYINPSQSLREESAEYVDRLIVEHAAELVVIDSIGELMALQGVKPNDDDAVAGLYRAIPRRWARLGAYVLLIDHVPKSNDRSPLYGIGSQRKRAAIDGAAYMVEQVVPFASGRDGRLRLVTAKDRNGWYATGSIAAVVDVAVGERLTFTIRAPQGDAEEARAGSMPTTVMAKITAWLYAQPGRRGGKAAMRKAKLCTANPTLDRALDALLDLGHIAAEEVPRRNGTGTDYLWISAFRPDNEDRSDDVSDPETN